MLRRELLKSAVAASAGFAAAQKEATKGELKAASYCIVELMGYKRLAGRIQQAPVPGLLQLDVPVEGGYLTQLINPNAVYRITICDEQAVKEIAKTTDPLPPICLDHSSERQLSIEHVGYDPY